jgi:integrase
MASLNKQPNGGYAIQLVGTDGKRRSLRLGKIAKKSEESIRLRVEGLHACAVAKLPWDADLAAWTAGIGDDLAAKLAGLGLMPARQSQGLAAFLEAYISGRCLGDKGSTVLKLRQTAKDLTDFFGGAVDLRAVTPVMAEDFKRHYLERRLAAATVSRRLKMAGMFFTVARKRKLVPDNPFADVRHKWVNPEENQRHVSLEVIGRVLEQANPQWQILIALARLGGLRCPSEVLSLKWEHVNFETGRMTVPSCKTEHHGKAWRVVPIFADLRPHLERAFELAPEGAVYVVPGNYREIACKPGGWQNISLATRFQKIIRRAGLTPWPRLFQNLRASKETDLMQHHPIHVVTAWLGNTPRVALAHYLQTLERDFEKATGIASKGDGGGGAVRGAVEAEVVQFAVQSPADSGGLEGTDTPSNRGVPCVPVTPSTLKSRRTMPRVGLEPTTR